MEMFHCIARRNNVYTLPLTKMPAIDLQIFLHLQVYLCPGLPPAQPHFGGVVFQYVTTPTASQGGVKRSRRSRRVPLARGGRYDPLLSEFRRPGKQQNHPNVSLVGVSIMWEGLMGGVLNAYQQGNVSTYRVNYLCFHGST